MVEISMNILLVDDEQEILKIYKGIIQEVFPKVRVMAASDGLLALKCCGGSLKFSLILTDLQMPNMDGIAFIKALRSGGSVNKFTPAVLVSGYTSNTNDPSLASLGIHLLPKPVNFTDLVQICADSLGISPIQDLG
ncbi:MAG: response regulator [Pseudobdellovibrionaceae bacterium]|nr:response regulator [Pseudobdellovibrionaceae bacterium]